jgi:membrane fusion protein (multidrug efflux system)
MDKRIITAFVMIVVTFSCKEKKEAPAKTQQLAIVDVLVAQTKNIVNTVEANGSVVAYEYVELHPEVSGRITYLNVPEGKVVQQGTLIARIYDADLQAQLAKSKVQLSLAEKTQQRDKKLLDINGINQSDYDAVENQVEGFKADINYYQSLIEKTYIKAPFTGLVGLRQISPGSYATPSTIVATVQQVNKIKVDFTVPQQYADLIQKGKTVDIEADGGKSARRKAVIIATEPQINQIARNLKVRAILDGSMLNPGAFVKVYLSAGADNKAVLVPANCIIPDDKNKQVVVIKNGKANFVNVETGVRQSGNVEITKGVNVGDTIVVTGVLFARPKAPVKIRAVKTLEQLNK